MKKILITLFLFLFVLGLGGCIVIPDVFTPMMEGQRQAEFDNRQDAQRAIAANIALFNQTGDYTYLCNAASWGSMDAIAVLRQNRVTCCFQDQSGKKTCGQY